MKGFTLLEVLITIGIVTVMGALLMVVMVNSAGLFTKESSNLKQNLNSNDALVHIRSSIKSSSSLLATYIDEGTTYTSGASQLILKTPSLDSSNNVIIDSFDTYVYFLDSNKLRFKSFPAILSSRKAQDQILTTIADSLIFHYFDSTNQEVVPTSAVKVKISLTLKQNSLGNYQIQTATSEASLRND